MEENICLDTLNLGLHKKIKEILDQNEDILLSCNIDKFNDEDKCQ